MQNATGTHTTDSFTTGIRTTARFADSIRTAVGFATGIRATPEGRCASRSVDASLAR